MVEELNRQAVHGRGAVGSPKGRYDRYEFISIDDGWEQELSCEQPKFQTPLHVDKSRTIINTVTSPDLSFVRSMNPYKGCEHGCIYCYARPSHNYLGFSPGLDFETEIFFKPDAPHLLQKELNAPGYKVYPVNLGSNTDCYQPIERQLKLTRQLLSIFHDYHHPVTLITKSALILRDIDLLSSMATQNLVQVYVSLTTLNHKLARLMEPRAAAPYRRLNTIETLTKAGIPVAVMTAPIIPGLNDMEIETLLEMARQAGALSAAYTLIRLPHELQELFEEWLHTHQPERAKHVLSLIRQTRDGKLNSAQFHERHNGKGAYAELIANRFYLACKRLAFQSSLPRLRTDLFQVPGQSQQLTLDFI